MSYRKEKLHSLTGINLNTVSESELKKLCNKFKIPLIEDAAHALGATYNNKPIGSISDFTMFSFQAIKHITTADGGMLCVKNKNLIR